MDFNDSPAEAAFRAEARAFLSAHAELKNADNAEYRGRWSDAEALSRARAWQACKAEAGFAAITWPAALGGRGGTSIQQVIYGEEEAAFAVPRGMFEITLGMCLPTLMAYAGPGQVERFVPPALHGREIWCQLFSEPGAGSDLAGLTTRAVRDGDTWIVNGQKTWTSGAHIADFGLLLLRSDAGVPKHKGLTAFFVDMRSPGIEVRRIKQMAGTSHFNEVFFTDVHVPDAQRLGEIGGGWKVALTTLGNERLAVGDVNGPDYEDIVRLARQVSLGGRPAIEDSAVRSRIADWYVQTQGMKLIKFRTLTALSRGQTPGPESSLRKVVNGPKLQAIASFGLDLLGSAGALMDPKYAPMHAWFQEAYFQAAGSRVAGGTAEVLLNIIAERVLGMPAEMRVDKDLPFNRIAK